MLNLCFFFIGLFVVYISCKDHQEVDVLVIGSGISGLSAASILAQNGKTVAVIDQCENIGGSLQTFTRIGLSGKTYSFEPGMHILNSDTTGFNAISGLNITMNPFGHIIDMVFPNTTKNGLSLPLGIENAGKVIMEAFPNEKSAIEFYFETLSNARNLTYTMKELLGSITTDKKLQYTLSYMENYDSFDKYPVLMYSNLWRFAFSGVGGSFPSGSSERIVGGTLKMIKTHGGKIYPGCRAKQLHLSLIGDKVEGVDTSCGYFKTENVVSTMGGRNTFTAESGFIDRHVLEKTGYLKKAEALQFGISAMIFFMGFNTSGESIGLPKANVWYSNLRYGPPQNENEMFEMNDVFCSCLSCRDPLYPSDRSDFFCLSIVEYEWFSKWEDSKTHERPKDYYEFKQKFEDEALKWVFEVFPKTRDHIDVVVTSSPLTMRDYLNHQHGTVYAAKLDFSEMDWLKAETKIPGLFLAGQDVAGGGVDGSLASGINAAQAILKK